jgi:hypothetical protein
MTMTFSTDLPTSDVDSTDLGRPDPAQSAAALIGGGLQRLPESVLFELLTAIDAELVARDTDTLIAGLREHLRADSADPQVRELIEEYGAPTAVLFGTEEWETGYLLADHADLIFSAGYGGHVSLWQLQEPILAVSAALRPLGFASEYRVNLQAGTADYAPIGFPLEARSPE